MRNSDAWLTLGFVVAAASVTLLAPAGPPYHALDVVGVGLAVGSALCLLWRRVAPIPVVFATSALVVVNAAAGYATTVTRWPAWISLFTLFSLRGATARIIGSMHVKHVPAKLDVRDRTQAVVWAYRTGFAYRGALPVPD
ncbi:hypothetical protein [Embleya scabrispora]|uniref:hypothetical protein n=1 Tax=Embleya scabrispora TaxID=159449 RepID=UPI0003746443|nr:hypothetical protein [Embleya scabrispora]